LLFSKTYTKLVLYKIGGGVSDDGWTTAGGGGRISTPRGPLEINKLKVKHVSIT
jgi:hypothetical protein